ncbi:MAG: HAD family phosphatase [Pseudomonadota bacterium]
MVVIFDLDGLLADTEPIWSESEKTVLSRRGVTHDPDLKPKIMGRHPLEVAKILVCHYRLDDDPNKLMIERFSVLEQLYRKGIPPCAGAQKLVAQLADHNILMAVASGSPQFLIKVALKQLGLEKSIHIFVGSDEVERGKPAPDIFGLAAKRLGVAPKQCIVLEDSAAGIQAALAAGMICVAVPSPQTPKIEAQKAHLVVDSLTKLTPTILEEVFKNVCAGKISADNATEIARADQKAKGA